MFPVYLDTSKIKIPAMCAWCGSTDPVGERKEEIGGEMISGTTRKIYSLMLPICAECTRIFNIEVFLKIPFIGLLTIIILIVFAIIFPTFDEAIGIFLILSFILAWPIGVLLRMIVLQVMKKVKGCINGPVVNYEKEWVSFIQPSFQAQFNMMNPDLPKSSFDRHSWIISQTKN